MAKQNAPGRKAEGVARLLAGDSDAYNTEALRCQYIARLGIPHNRAAIVAGLAFGEGRV